MLNIGTFGNDSVTVQTNMICVLKWWYFWCTVVIEVQILEFALQNTSVIECIHFGHNMEAEAVTDV